MKGPADQSEHLENNRGFWALIITQFQGAFNDNAYKTLLLMVALHTATSLQQRNVWSSIIPAFFIAPFLLFSMYGGYLADRLSKRSVIIGTKIAEILIMLAAAVAFMTGNLWLSVSILFLMGSQSAFFGPSKYGIIPELVPEKRISWANGHLELYTFAAIILGTFAGSFLSENFSETLYYCMLTLAGLSTFGLISSLFVTRVSPAAPNKPLKINFLGDLFSNIQLARKDRVLWLGILGNTYFWFIAAVFITNIPVYSLEILKITDTQIGFLLATLALGIGVGSYAAGHLSGNKIEYGLIPLGATILAFGSLDLFLFAENFTHVLVTLAITGFGGGFYAVPVHALIQYRPNAKKRGGILGMSYMLSNVGIIMASAFFYLLTVQWGLAPLQVFLVIGLLTILVTFYAVTLVPDSLMRLVLWLLTQTFYRIKVVGRDNIPEKGGALFVSNHFAFIDAFYLIASTDRFIRFIMHTDLYNHPLLKPFAKMLRVIPMSAYADPRTLIHSFREAIQAIKDGDVVCIFAEGQLTRTGQMLPFRRGFERIMKSVEAPIIPIHLDRVWGSIFSFERGKFYWKIPHRIPYHITVQFGKAMSSSASVIEVRQAVQELSAENFIYRKRDMRPLHHAAIRESRSHRLRFSMADGLNPKVRSIGVIIRSIVLGHKMKQHWKNQEMVGLLVPPSVAGACLNLAALLCGKIPVNLNYTASQEAIQSAADQCKISTIVTARALLEKIKIKLPGKVIILEDLAPTISIHDKLKAIVKAWFYPVRWIEKSLGCTRKWTIDDIATVIFSSGTTGDPKGVMLSHYNIYSNVEGSEQVLPTTKEDKIMGILPFFHSFGFTGTLWSPLIKGFGVVYHPNPIDARAIASLTQKYQVTMLTSTPTFLQNYLQRVDPSLFSSLQYVIAGAEKLPNRLGLAFEEKFGVRPFEGYGCTECSPIVSFNIPSFRAPGYYQVGSKRGSIGHPLPGVAVRIVDPETLEPKPFGESGLLLVKGPNIMMGYLGKPEKTSEVLKDKWYITGDIASLDEDGFLFVQDRLSRFSKIGGEMVPHIKVEEILHELLGITEQSFAVTAVPDERKGEKLVVLHTVEESQLEEVLKQLPHSGLPNLWVPRSDCFYKIESIPILGTGKLDLRQVKKMALSLSSSQDQNI